MFDTVTIFVFLTGVFVTSLFIFGLKLYNDEMKAASREKRDSKLSYRTNEEFVGRD